MGTRHSGKESACQYRRRGFHPWVGKNPCRRKWLPTPLFLPGKFHGQKSLVTTVHGVAKSQTWLSDWAHTHTPTVKYCFHFLLYLLNISKLPFLFVDLTQICLAFSEANEWWPISCTRVQSNLSFTHFLKFPAFLVTLLRSIDTFNFPWSFTK